MKKRSWKQVLAGLLAIAVMVTSVPPVTVQAAPSQDTVQEYDYAKMYSLEEGKTGDYIAGYYKDMGEEPRREMNYGEMTYLEFALSYNTPVKMELYIRGEAVPVGYVYGISYDGHVDKTGFAVPIYTAKPEMNQTQIRNGMVALSKTAIYKAMSACPGISLTGLTAAYGTLAEYYSYYGIEAPGAMNDEVESKEAETEDEALKDTAEPEKDSSVQPEDAPTAEENASENDSSVQTEQENIPEQKGEEEPEPKAPAADEKDVPLVQSAPERVEDSAEEGTNGKGEAGAEGEEAEKSPAEETPKQEPAEEIPVEEPDEQEPAEKDSQKDVPEEKEPVQEAPEEDVPANEAGQEQESEADADILLSDPEELDEEDYPEDFFIPYPG